MICLLGKGGSGKDTIVKKLVKDYDYEKVITFTTRPPRKNEKNKIDYYFISETEFDRKIMNGFFAEFRSYKSCEGTWYYGSAKRDFLNLDDENKKNEKKVIILTPDGLKNLKKQGYKFKSIYIYTSGDVILDRLTCRDENLQEIIRRINADNKDFDGVENLVDGIVYNNTLKDLDTVVWQIVNYDQTLKLF